MTQAVEEAFTSVGRIMQDLMSNPEVVEEMLRQSVALVTGEPAQLTFGAVRRVNGQRSDKWHERGQGWVASDWSNAMCGEAGEAANVVKKIRRAECGFPGAADPDRDTLVANLADEIADTFLYLDLLARHFNIDMSQAVAAKFNRVSEREGFEEKL